jgi:hypothetical protein
LLTRALEGDVVDLMLEHAGLQVAVLDASVNTGPVRIIAKARLEDPDGTMARWTAAEADASVALKWRTEGLVTITRIQSTS